MSGPTPGRSSRLSKATSQVSERIGSSSQPLRSQVKKNKGLTTADAESPQKLYLRINRKFLLLHYPLTADQQDKQPLPPPPGATTNLNVIIANLPELRPFAGDTIDWLVKVARLIFEPLGTTSLYTFSTESLEWWLDREMEASQWRKVVPGEPLKATIYEFRPDNDASILALTRMSLRSTRSVTTRTSVPRAATFRGALFHRDRACVVTQGRSETSLVSSHLIPRCLGDLGVQSVAEHFIGSPTVVDRYDPTIGVLLFIGLADQYIVHSFVDIPLNIYGGELFTNERVLHGCQIALKMHDPSLSLPLAGVFDWHYTQCVLKKFATPAYKAINNVYHQSLPFRTRDVFGSDDESVIDFDDERNIADPPYPSYFWDLSALRARQRLEALEHSRAIVAWNSGVSVGNERDSVGNGEL